MSDDYLSTLNTPASNPPAYLTRAHIVSPGPSLAFANIPDDHAPRIGINLAGAIRPDITLDWMCFGDALAAYKYQEKRGAWPTPEVGFIVPVEFTQTVRTFKPTALVLPWDWLQMPTCRDYSTNVAVWAAFVMGAREIHLWGCDQGGDFYADGTPCVSPEAIRNEGSAEVAQRHHEERWVDERSRFQAILRRMSQRAPETKVIRHRAAQVDMGSPPG